MRTQLLSSMTLVTALFLVGCSDDDGGGNTTETDTGTTPADTATSTDTGSTTEDTGTPADTATDDTGTPMDTGGGGDTGGDTGGMAPTFTQVYNNIIAAKCATCHTTATSGNLDMKNKNTAHAELLKKAEGVACAAGMKTRVVPGNAAMSLLVEKVKMATPSCGARMPAGRAPLSDAEIKTIEDWINAGALNN